MKNCILAVLVGAVIAASGPAQAERMLTQNDTVMHKQLCSTNASDSSCSDGLSAKDLLLANGSNDGPGSENPPTFVTSTVEAVPEPSSWITLAIGALALVAFSRKRRG